MAFGQKRALMVWQRIILPDGRPLQMDDVPATDPSGCATVPIARADPMGTN